MFRFGIVPILSIIIPTFNEATTLKETLNTLGDRHEILIVDGGSTDGTESLIQKGCTLVQAPEKGRAAQMNYGAALAQGDVFLFLHADTLISAATIDNLLTSLEWAPDVVGGACYRFFDSRSRLLKATCHLANIRSKYFGLFLGDQGIFVRREIFQTLKGFEPSLPYGEDLDFSIRMSHIGKTIAVKPPVLTSARRFEDRGIILQTLIDLHLVWQLLRKYR